MVKLYVTAEQFSKIIQLELKCVTPDWDFKENKPFDHFNDDKWIKGLREICGAGIDKLLGCGRIDLRVIEWED